MTAADWPTSTDPLAMFRDLRGTPRLSPSRWFRWKATEPPPLPRDKLAHLLDAVIAAQADPLDRLRLTELKLFLENNVPFAQSDGGLAVFLVSAGATATYEQVIATSLTARRHDPPLADAVRCLFADPFQPLPDPVPWRTPTAVAIAQGVVADDDWSRLPVLADALEDAGCDHEPLLHHLRAGGGHRPGCHALEAVLGR